MDKPEIGSYVSVVGQVIDICTNQSGTIVTVALARLPESDQRLNRIYQFQAQWVTPCLTQPQKG